MNEVRTHNFSGDNFHINVIIYIKCIVLFLIFIEKALAVRTIPHPAFSKFSTLSNLNIDWMLQCNLHRLNSETESCINRTLHKVPMKDFLLLI
jgi:hypothetical protein